MSQIRKCCCVLYTHLVIPAGRLADHICVCMFTHPAYYRRAFLSPSHCLDATQIRGVTEQPLLPPPHYGTRLHFYCENIPSLFSLVDSRRIVHIEGAVIIPSLVPLDGLRPTPAGPSYTNFGVKNYLLSFVQTSSRISSSVFLNKKCCVVCERCYAYLVIPVGRLVGHMEGGCRKFYC